MTYDTKEEILATGRIDQEFAALLAKLNMPPPNFDDIFELRAQTDERFVEAKAALGGPPEGVQENDEEVPLRDGQKTRAIVCKPTHPPASGSPLVVLFHGGGFCIGEPEGETPSSRNLCQSLGATCVSCTYRLAPENPFPAAVEDGWDALKWAAANAKKFGADPSQGFVVGGTSAGANIAAVITLRARDEKLSPALTGQYLSVLPAVNPQDLPEKYKHLMLSAEQNHAAPVLPQAAINLFMRNYKADDKSWLFHPLQHPDGLSGLPPAYFQVCGLDPLRDDSFIYEKKLQDEGVKTKLDMYAGLPHAFWAFFPHLSAAVKFRHEQMTGIGWLLGKTPDVEKVKLKAVAYVA